MKKSLLICFAVLYSTIMAAQVPQIEKDALMALFNGTDGANWVNNTNWGTTNPVSSWHGITVENIGGTDHVKSLDLSFNNLVGSIPTEIGNLTELEFLALWDNTLTGNIPDELGNCTHLKIMSLEDNQLTGNIPPSFANLTVMYNFWINGNLFSGDIPNIFSAWPDLKYFSIGDDNFSGNYNQFTGDLDLSNNPLLVLVLLDHNNISTLNVRNGNNSNLSTMEATDNPNLTCVFVDDKNNIPPYWEIDPNATYVETQAECDALGTEGFSATTFNIYPNPAKGFFIITSKTSVELVSVYGISGKLIKTFAEQNEYDISGLSKGLYLINIQSKMGSSVEKLIIE